MYFLSKISIFLLDASNRTTENILHLLLCLPCSSPQHHSFGFLSSAATTGVSWEVVTTSSVPRCIRSLYQGPIPCFQCLTARPFRITHSQAASFQVDCIPKGLAYAEWLIRAQTAQEFSASTIVQNNCGCRVPGGLSETAAPGSMTSFKTEDPFCHLLQQLLCYSQVLP